MPKVKTLSAQVSVKLDRELYVKIQAEAKQNERPISAQFRIILRERYA